MLKVGTWKCTKFKGENCWPNYRNLKKENNDNYSMSRGETDGYDLLSISLIPDSAIPEFAHIPDPENFSPAQKQLAVCFVQSGCSDIPDSKS